MTKDLQRDSPLDTSEPNTQTKYWYDEILPHDLEIEPQYLSLVPGRTDSKCFSVAEGLEVFQVVHKYIFATALGREVNITPNIMFVAEVTAHAHMHGLIHRIAQPLKRLVDQLQNSKLMEDIAREPLFYLGLSRQLEAPAMWSLAMKHCVGGGFLSATGYDELGGYLIDDSSLLVAAKLSYEFGNRLGRLNEALLSDNFSTPAPSGGLLTRSNTIRSVFAARNRKLTKQAIAERLILSLTNDWIRDNVVYNNTYYSTPPAWEPVLHHSLHMSKGCAFPYLEFLGSDMPVDLINNVSRYYKSLGLKKDSLMDILTRHINEKKSLIRDFLCEAPTAPASPTDDSAYFTNFVFHENLPFAIHEDYRATPPAPPASLAWLRYIGEDELAEKVADGRVTIGSGPVVIDLPECKSQISYKVLLVADCGTGFLPAEDVWHLEAYYGDDVEW